MPKHVDAMAQVEEVHVKEKLRVLEVCVILKVHHKVFQKILRQDHRPEQLSKENRFFKNSSNSNNLNNCNKKSDRFTFEN